MRFLLLALADFVGLLVIMGLLGFARIGVLPPGHWRRWAAGFGLWTTFGVMQGFDGTRPYNFFAPGVFVAIWVFVFAAVQSEQFIVRRREARRFAWEEMHAAEWEANEAARRRAAEMAQDRTTAALAALERMASGEDQGPDMAARWDGALSEVAKASGLPGPESPELLTDAVALRVPPASETATRPPIATSTSARPPSKRVRHLSDAEFEQWLKEHPKVRPAISPDEWANRVGEHLKSGLEARGLLKAKKQLDDDDC